MKPSSPKYHHNGNSFYFKYEIARHLKSLGWSNRNIVDYILPDIYPHLKNDPYYVDYKVRAWLDYRPAVKSERTSETKLKVSNTTTRINGLDWVKVEYYKLSVGSEQIRISPSLFKRLDIKEGILTIE